MRKVHLYLDGWCDNSNIIAVARIRTIQPAFARSPSMGRVSRDARLLFVLLWTIVDDMGRCLAVPDDFARALFPGDSDAPVQVDRWLDELEREDCIERYAVDDVAYLRVVHWHRHQWIAHPSPSLLPASPRERPSDPGIQEASGSFRKTVRPAAKNRGGRTTWGAREHASGILRKKRRGRVACRHHPAGRVARLAAHPERAEADGSHPSALRSLELAAKIGLAADSAGQDEYDDDMGPSPAERLRPPGISSTEMHGPADADPSRSVK
jgi:hypothetical protein